MEFTAALKLLTPHKQAWHPVMEPDAYLFMKDAQIRVSYIGSDGLRKDRPFDWLTADTPEVGWAIYSDDCCANISHSRVMQK